ncbi:MAG: low molecular weight phosphatase [Phycisphaerae bacterium]|nr:MAG: low molecular weight phosphatase [Phycisphaerae bacterium]
MAEAIGRSVAGDQFEFLSCGSNPAGFVHPLSLDTLKSMDIPTGDLESKSWDKFLEQDIAIAITVCDSAAQTCPVFPGGGVKVHWPLPDPSQYPGDEEEQLEFCKRIAARIQLKIERMAAIDRASLSTEELTTQLAQLRDL